MVDKVWKTIYIRSNFFLARDNNLPLYFSVFSLILMEKEKAWQTVLETLKINLSAASFSTWFSQTFIIQSKEIDDNRQILEIGCPNTFVRNTIENRYYALIKEAIDQVTERKNDLVFVVKQLEHSSESNNTPLFSELIQKVEPKKENIDVAIKKAGLRPDFTFDNFAVSSTNQMAHAAASAVSQTPGTTYNPLFLYGGVGVGKTHLMQAVAHEILKKNAEAKIVYCTSEDFTNGIIDAIRRKTTEEFKQHYRSANLLMVDDIQFIAGKDRAQEEFFHTFNSITRIGGQIILTSDRRPDEIDKLEDRLRSRFEGGLAIDIQQPDFELRTAILLIKAQQKGASLPMDVAQLVAGNVTSTRKLEGVLVRLLAEAKTKNESLSPELASAILGTKQDNQGIKRVVRPREVISAVATYFELKTSDLTGSRRSRPIVVPRQIIMYILRNELKLPLTEVGRLLGNRDHTTIMHGVDKIVNSLPISEELRVDMAGIKQKLYG